MIKRRSFLRHPGVLRYKKLFIIAVEGCKTEPQYFNNLRQETVCIKILTHQKQSAPMQVLKRMKRQLKENELKKSDEAWLVVDKDQWQDEQLQELHSWSLTQENYNLALSNPNFEYWLLLHFEDGNNISSSSNCIQRLKKYMPKYDKNINFSKINNDIEEAITRAKNRDVPPSEGWPREIGKTTVYKLVENILRS